MKKVLRLIRNIIFGIILVVYLSIIIGASTLVLNRNDYGYTEFGNKALIDLKEDTDKYLKGQLVIVEKAFIDNLKVGDEVFVYQTNQQEKTVKVVSSAIKEVNKEETTPYITISADNTSWGQDYIAGQTVKVYDSIGGILTFIESKWIFFVIFIVPCFFILLYEIYSVIVVIKFDGEEVVLDAPVAATAGTGTGNPDDINVLMGQLNDLKAQLGQNPTVPAVNSGQPIGQTQLQQMMGMVAQPPVIDQNQPQMAGQVQPVVQPQVQGVVQEQPQIIGQTPVQSQVQQVQTQMQPQIATPAAAVQQPVSQVQPQVVAQAPVQQVPQMQSQAQPQMVTPVAPVQQPVVQPQVQPQVATPVSQVQPQVVVQSPVQSQAQPQMVTPAAPVQQPVSQVQQMAVQEQPQIISHVEPQIVNSTEIEVL